MLLEIQPTPSDYLPVLILLGISLGFVVVTIVATHLLGPKRKTLDKLENFESGIDAVGNARQPLNVKYFLVAILFVLFDIEIVFFYPYAVNFRELGYEAYFAVLIFVAFFLIGFYYVLKKGILNWSK